MSLTAHQRAQLRDQMMRWFDADLSVQRQSRLTWQGSPAIDLTFPSRNRLVHGRLRAVVANHHLIMVMAATRDRDRVPRDARRFLNSLRVY